MAAVYAAAMASGQSVPLTSITVDSSSPIGLSEYAGNSIQEKISNAIKKHRCVLKVSCNPICNTLALIFSKLCRINLNAMQCPPRGVYVQIYLLFSGIQ